MGFLLPIIGAGVIAAAAAFGKKKGSSAGSEMPDGIDEATLFPAAQMQPVVTEEPRKETLVQPVQTSASTAASSVKPATNVVASKIQTTASTAASSIKPAAAVAASKIQTVQTVQTASAVKLPYPSYPRVLFLKTKIGSFSATTLISKMQQAITSKNMTALATAYKEFMALNNDQVRYFHNKYFEQYKATPYAGWRTIKLSTGQHMISNLLTKLIGAGVGEVPKEKI